MLVLHRKEKETIHIFPVDGLDPNMTIAELFKDGSIIIRVIELTKGNVSLGIIAPRSLSVAREEILVLE